MVTACSAAYGPGRMIPLDFMGFAGDCQIFGRLTMIGDRLTDMLNGQEQFRLRDVVLESLVDGHRVELAVLHVERSELYAAIAAGPQGIQDRRIRTEAIRMQIGLGPYLVLGTLHSAPGADPLSSVLYRSPMVPLTDATIAFTRAGAVEALDAATLIVNREHAEWIQPAADEGLVFPNVPIRGSLDGRNLAKDLTGSTLY